MPPLHTEFDDLTSVVDDVHALFERWAAGGVPAPPLDPAGREVLKLAVHEWIANLVQHADFGGRTPAIRLRVISEGRRARCVIEDNSEGFDLEAQTARALDVQRTSEELTERGRGLLMLLACTENLSYRTCPPLGGDGLALSPWQRLEFWVTPEGGEPGHIPFGPHFGQEHPPPGEPQPAEAWYALRSAFGQESACAHEAPPSDGTPPPLDRPPAS